MRGILKKTTTFTTALIMLVTLFLPTIKTEAQEIKSSNYVIKTILANEYTDGVKYGDGYLMLKNGKFDNMTKDTIFTFIDNKGNKKDIKNENAFTEAYGPLSQPQYFVDFGVLPVGKAGKMALMDSQGILYGGKNNYYSAVSYAGDNMFYTTNATEGSKDKFNTTIWTLRKKDGTVIKEFKNLSIRDRINFNGNEFIFYSENNIGKFIKVDTTGKITELATGYEYCNITDNYISLNKSGKSSAKTMLFNNNGIKLGEYEGIGHLDLHELEIYGYMRVSQYKENIFSNNIIDSNGKLLFEEGKYYYTDIDSERVLTWDFDDNILLKDRKTNKIIYNCKDIIKELGGTIRRVNYHNSILSISLHDTNLYPDLGTTILMDKNGSKIGKPLKGIVQEFKNGYFIIEDVYNYKYFLVNSNGKIIKEADDMIYFQPGDLTGKIIATQSDYYTGKSNLY